MSDDIDMKDLQRRMDGAVTAFRNDLSGLRTGRASASLVEPITAEVYGSPMPLSQLATISVPEPRMITINVWDKSAVAAVDKAIRESNLGLNPATEGQVIRVPLPELNEERRKELAKVVHKYAEQARVAARHVRKDGMDQIKKAEKDGMSEDDQRRLSDEVQKITDATISEIDKLADNKEAEILEV